jgi:Zn-finger nucleic acid-binding protein
MISRGTTSNRRAPAPAPTPAPTPAPVCPNCRSALQLEHDGELDAWACPQHHGLGFTVSAAYERMDDNEIHTIWQQARTANAGSRPCPICATTMVSVTVAPTAEATTLSLDVCLVDEFIWFDAGELDEIPVDTNEPAPNPDEEAHIAQITQQFGSELTAEWSERDSETLRDHLLHRLGPRDSNG